LHVVNLLNPFVRLARLGDARYVHEGRVVPIVRKEWSRLDRRVVVIVVGEFRHRQQICPIVLSMRIEHPQVRLHPLVVIFDLTLCLWVVCHRETQFDSEVFVDALREISHER
jgi:hypothetical protein